MSIGKAVEDPVRLEIENIGGIETATVSVSPGVTALVGRNATNRTSFLQAVMAACGSDQVSLKGDAEEGQIVLTFGEETYTRQLNRRGDGSIMFDGEPYLEDTTVADLFAFLLESNEARRAVVQNTDLRDLIMRPIDTESIQAEIDQLEADRRNLDAEIDELDSLNDRLPNLEARRQRLDDRIETKREELADKRDEFEAADADLDASREEKTAREEKLDELRETRSDLERTRAEFETERESLSSLREELANVEEEFASLPETPAGDQQEIERDLERLRDRKQTIETRINQLQRIIQFNETMLEGTDEELLRVLSDGESEATNSEGAITDQLLAGSELTCWTCGSDVNEAAIETTLDRLREYRTAQVEEVSAIDSNVKKLQHRQREFDQQRQQRERLDRRQDDLEREIETTESTIETLTERREALGETIEDLEDEIEALENEDQSELLEVHRETNQLDFEIDRLTDERAEIDEEIASIEDQLDQREQLEQQREGIRAELEELRTRIERIEQGAIEQFNEHMKTVLDVLGYENLERIWLERREAQVREGRQTVTKSVFDLHVVRRDASGANYEDTINHLSESEREVTGLVFALAGYLVHEAYEMVPFMLLDSLEAVDAERIATLVEYFSEHAEYLIVALLPEDAAALDDDYERVTEI